MSRQINFYAAPEDTEKIHQWLLTEFPGLTLVSQRRGPPEHMVPLDAKANGAFWVYPVSCLIPSWSKELLAAKYMGDKFPDEFIITAQNNPVIEYHPCHWDEATKTVTGSRFYWSFSGDLPADSMQQINKLFRWVQRNTIAAKGPFFRFFPVAAKISRYARQHLTWPSAPNPLLQHEKPHSMKIDIER